MCKWKGVNRITAEECPDHVHMLVEVSPVISVLGSMGSLNR